MVCVRSPWRRRSRRWLRDRGRPTRTHVQRSGSRRAASPAESTSATLLLGWHRCTHATTPSPVRLLLNLAADVIELSGANRVDPIEVEGIRERFLPEAAAHTKAQQHKSMFALRAAAMLRGGVDPGLLDEVSWWRTDDLWYWSLEALITYLRAGADRTGESIEVFCGRVAERLDVTIED